MISVNMVGQNLSNYLPPGMFETFSPDEVENAVYGSKFVFILEHFQLSTLWLCKACLLILYSSMTYVCPPRPPGAFSPAMLLQSSCIPSRYINILTLTSHSLGLPKQHRLVKIVGGYCIFGFVLVEVLFLAVWCRPITQYWQVSCRSLPLGTRLKATQRFQSITRNVRATITTL